MKSKFIGFPGALLMLSMFLYSCYSYGTITGKVVDDETGEPIEGAVIMAEWTETKGMIGLSHTMSYKVVEVVTDKDGKAIIPGVKEGKAIIMGISKPYIESPTVAVYKKGYVLWSNNHIFPGTKHHTDFKWRNNYVFRLERFKPEYSYRSHVSFIRRAIASGFGDKKLTLEAFEWERKKASEERKKTWKK